MSKMGTVYIEHLQRPYVGQQRPRCDEQGHVTGWPNKVQKVEHYIGWCAGDVAERHAQHAAGQGALLLQVVAAAGIEFQVTRTWPGDRAMERRLKNNKNTRRLCPACNPNAMRRQSK